MLDADGNPVFVASAADAGCDSTDGIVGALPGVRAAPIAGSLDTDRHSGKYRGFITSRCGPANAQTNHKKAFLFRELEHVAYQEMRRFILSGAQSRFVM